jgi:uncharacterized protein (TIGR02145 family)
MKKIILSSLFVLVISTLGYCQPEMTPKEGFYYSMKVSQYKIKDPLINAMVPLNWFDIYVRIFDLNNYKNSLNDEFKWPAYSKRIVNEIETGVSNCNFNKIYSFNSTATLGKYDMERSGFPIGDLYADIELAAFPLAYNSLTFRITPSWNISDFDLLLKMDPEKAQQFVASRKDYNGNINRTIGIKVIYNVVNKSMRDKNTGTKLYSGIYMHKILFMDGSVILGEIQPKTNYGDKANLLLNSVDNQPSNQNEIKTDKFSGVWSGHETDYTINLNSDDSYTVKYEDSEMNTETSIGYLEYDKLRFVTKGYDGKDYVHYFVFSTRNCLKDGNYEYCKKEPQLNTISNTQNPLVKTDDGKNEKKDEISITISEINNLIHSSRELIVKAKSANLSPEAINAVNADINMIETSIAEVKAVAGTERYESTLDKVKAIKEQARSINDELASAVEKYASKNNSDGFTVKDIDGNTYKTITIGSQVWMAENLKTTKLNDGTAIPNVAEKTAWLNNLTGAYCWYNNDAGSNKTNGVLYNWYTVSTGKLCPAGWHVPSTDEWETMFTYLGGKNIAGGKLKESGTTHWINPNVGATNETGFSALPVGICGGRDGAFFSNGECCFWWSSTVVGYDVESAFCIFIYNYENQAHNTTRVLKSGFSVRCIKD